MRRVCSAWQLAPRSTGRGIKSWGPNAQPKQAIEKYYPVLYWILLHELGHPSNHLPTMKQAFSTLKGPSPEPNRCISGRLPRVVSLATCCDVRPLLIGSWKVQRRETRAASPGYHDEKGANSIATHIMLVFSHHPNSGCFRRFSTPDYILRRQCGQSPEEFPNCISKNCHIFTMLFLENVMFSMPQALWPRVFFPPPLPSKVPPLLPRNPLQWKWPSVGPRDAGSAARSWVVRHLLGNPKKGDRSWSKLALQEQWQITVQSVLSFGGLLSI